MNGAYCWWDVRQSPDNATNQFVAKLRVPSMPIRPSTNESVYDASWLRSPPSSAVNVHGVSILDWAEGRGLAPGTGTTAEESGDGVAAMAPG